jgi:ubiquinone biosynthesis protein
VPDKHRVDDFAQAIRAVGEPIHARTADQISMARVLTQLFEITGLFDMSTRLELVMLQKTMVVVEGVARKLDPHLDMWATAEPVVGGWIAENLGPRGRLEDVGFALARMARLMIDAPERLDRLARLVETEADRPVSPGQTANTRSLAIPVALWAIFGALLMLVYHFR